MSYSGAGGIILILAGIAWIFMAQYASSRPRRRDASTADFLQGVLDWASKNIARKFLPGILMIVLGVFLLALG